MRTETRALFTFAELSDQAKEKAISGHRYWNVEGIEWWDGVYDDAERIGLKITSFDLGRSSKCCGYFTESPLDVAKAIQSEHGEVCETFRDACNFMRDHAEIIAKHPEDEEGYTPPEFKDEMEEAEKFFLQQLLESYRIMLEKEWEWLTSDECVAESLECNEVEFLEDGSTP